MQCLPHRTRTSDGSGTYENWNLIGNPYPSYLNMTDDSGDATNNFISVNSSVLPLAINLFMLMVPNGYL